MDPLRLDDVTDRLRDLDRRCLLLQRGIPLVHEEVDAKNYDSARRWLRRMVDLSPSAEHIAPLSLAIVRLTGDNQPYTSGCDSGGYYAWPKREHTLLLWSDLFKVAHSMLSGSGVAIGLWIEYMYDVMSLHARSDRELVSLSIFSARHAMSGSITMQRYDPDRHTSIPVEIYATGVVSAESWCPSLPAFTHELKVIAGAS